VQAQQRGEPKRGAESHPGRYLPWRPCGVQSLNEGLDELQ